MSDPAFQREMRKMTESPEFKQAMEQAQSMLEDLQKDPAKMNEFLKDLEKEMGNFGGLAGLAGAGGRGARNEL